MATVKYAVRINNEQNLPKRKEVVPEIQFYKPSRPVKNPGWKGSQRKAGKLECPRIDEFYLLAGELLYLDTYSQPSKYSISRWRRARVLCIAMRKVLLELRRDLSKLQKQRYSVDVVRERYEKRYRQDEIKEMRERGLEVS
jgi:hypothetical protein